MTFRFLTFLLVVLISGCGGLSRPTLPPIQNYFNADDMLVDVVPDSSKLDGKPVQVMWLLHASDKDQLKLKQELFVHYQNALVRQGILFEEQSKHEQRRVEKEIERAISQSGGEYMGRQSVDYYLRGTLLTSKFTQNYEKPIWCPFCEKDRPGTCEYKIKAELKLDVYELPSRQRIKSWTLKESDDHSFDALGSCRKPTDGLNTQALFENMRNEITADLKRCSAKDLRGYFSPEAYILRFYSDGKKHYFEISGGEGAGFKQGQSVNIFRLLPAEDGGGKYKLGEGKVTELVEPKRAIITVTDLELIEKIKPMDKVKVARDAYSLDLQCFK